jgi:4-hydroxy-4-methyl-2-oxoglutarate aldolase
MSTSIRLSHAEMLQLKRWNTPTIYNGWEQITRHDATAAGFNLEETRDGANGRPCGDGGLRTQQG